tara:strand:+ start:607 stop:1272 length:666 start_codon:yes stop_codon:yes gene_type:complete
MNINRIIALTAFFCLLLGCTKSELYDNRTSKGDNQEADNSKTEVTDKEPQEPESPETEVEPEEEQVAFAITTAFNDNTPIPIKYAREGEDASPPFGWGKSPDGSSSIVIQMVDLDVGANGRIHWIMIDIDPSMNAIKENITNANIAMEAPGASQLVVYGGPNPPVGDDPHKYETTIYAIQAGATVDDNLLGVNQNQDAPANKAALEAISIDKIVITGTYER